MYRIKALVGNLKFYFDDIDWEKSSLQNFRFSQRKEDVEVKTAQFKVQDYSNIVYVVEKFNPET